MSASPGATPPPRVLFPASELFDSFPQSALENAQQHLERGRNGQTVLLWLGQHYADGAIRFDPANPDDIAATVAAQRWLASAPALTAAAAQPRFAGVDSALPSVSLSMGA